jgi:hypothetical protein
MVRHDYLRFFLLWSSAGSSPVLPDRLVETQMKARNQRATRPVTAYGTTPVTPVLLVIEVVVPLAMLIHQ